MGKKGKKGKGKGQKTSAEQPEKKDASSDQPGPSQPVRPEPVQRPSEPATPEAAATRPSQLLAHPEAAAPVPSSEQRQPASSGAAAPRPAWGAQPASSGAAAPRPAWGAQPTTLAAGAKRPSQPVPQLTPSEVVVPRPSPQQRQPPPSEVAGPRQPTPSDSRGAGPPQQVALPKGDGDRGGKKGKPADTTGLVEALQMLKYPRAPSLRTVRDKEFPEKQVGSGGRQIRLIANYFAVDIPHGFVYHYDVDIQPFKESKTAVAPKQPLRRRFPARLCRLIIDTMVSQYRNVLKCYPAYDGNKNLYTREPIPEITGPKKFTVAIQEDGKEVKFVVVIKPAIKDAMGGTNAVSLEPLHALARGRSAEIFEEAVMALDIILRHGPALRFVPVSRSFFMKPRSPDVVPLGEGRDIWFGYYQSLRPGWKPFDNTTSFYVNIDKVGKAFYTAGPILAHVKAVLNLQNLPQRFSDFQIKILTKELKGLKVEVTHLPYRRKYQVVRVTRETANKITFPDDNGETSDIASYFKKKYKRSLQYPHYPCLQVKPENRNICLPLEVCELVDSQPCNKVLSSTQQATMVQKSAIPPVRRFTEIERMAKLMTDNSRNSLKEFDVDINLKPLKLEGRVIDPPNVEFASQQVTRPRDGQWEVGRSGFWKGAEIKSWIILNFCNYPKEPDLQRLAKNIQVAGGNSGMKMDNVQAVHMVTGRSADVLLEFQKRYKQLQLMVVILGKMDMMYKHVKTVSETSLGIPTQCMTDENAKRCGDPKFSHRYILNLCLKINAKMGGSNSRLPGEFKPPMFSKPIMIIGADVSHPAPGGEEKYSIASAAGSMDAGPSQYMATVELQKIRTEVKAREERILNLQVMIVRLLKEFGRRTGRLPETLIYYRDGVSEGQFGPVRDYEIVQIRMACTELKPDYEPKITFIIVQKRHHTRFIPENLERDGVGRMKNVPPGTIVDAEITHPSFFDWFLCSHLGIQGTSRPAHYSVVWDDSDFSANILQKLSFYLCHTNSRCTKSVSIPPPVVYADLMAYRAKLYINSARETMGESSASSTTSGSDGGIIPTRVEDAIKLSERIKTCMFFV